MEFLYFLLIGALSGWLAGQIWKGAGFGLIVILLLESSVALSADGLLQNLVLAAADCFGRF